MPRRKNIDLLFMTAFYASILSFAGCAEPDRIPTEVLERFDRAGNLETLAGPCSGIDLPGLPGVKSGWIQQNNEATTLQFSNLGLGCDEDLLVGDDGRNIIDFEDCNLPDVAWWNHLSLALPPIDEIELGKTYLQPKPENPFDGPPRNSVKLVHPGERGKRGCGLLVGNGQPQGQVSVVIEERTPSCIAGRVSGVGVVDILAISGRYLLSPDGRFVAQRCK